MQRGQVAVASAYTKPTTQLAESEMSEHQWPRRRYRHPLSHPPECRQNYSATNKPKKSRQPCLKLLSSYGCPYGDKCRFSHELSTLYPVYYDRVDSTWSKPHSPATYHSTLSPQMPKCDPVRSSSSFHTDSGKLFKETILRQDKGKEQQVASEDGSEVERNRSEHDTNLILDMPSRQYDRRIKNMQKCDGISGGDSAEFCNYLVSQPEYAPQPQPRVEEHQYSLPQYLAEEEYYRNLSMEVEAFVEDIDTRLDSMKAEKQEAVNSLQKLVRSLWSDTVIAIYGSSYTHLALPVSDIDCVLLVPSLVGERPLTILEALAAEVERQPWTKHLELLGSAKIPVLKITYSLDPTKPDVLLDLTCGHSVGHTGLATRDLIYSLQIEMPALRPLVLVLKSYLISNGLNCAYTGGISSYVLVLLVIRFLQACGTSHFKSFASTTGWKLCENRRRSYSEDFPEELVSNQSRTDALNEPKWCYTFSRGGHVTWCTGIGSLLMLFLETYITFDYRRFGISIENEGEYFLLPPENVVSIQGSPVIPYVADPFKAGRSICNCFRMHEVIQSWLILYQGLAAGAPLATCVGGGEAP